MQANNTSRCFSRAQLADVSAAAPSLRRGGRRSAAADICISDVSETNKWPADSDSDSDSAGLGVVLCRPSAASLPSAGGAAPLCSVRIGNKAAVLQ